MKKQFSKEYMSEHCGCYSETQLQATSFMQLENITLSDILKSEIPLKDKIWFLFRKTEMELRDKLALSLKLAEAVLPIYENEYPNDSRVRDCIEAIVKFNNGEISSEELNAAGDAAANPAAYAAADAAFAAYAAGYAADAANATFAAYAAGDAAAYAAGDAAAYAAGDAAAYAAADAAVFEDLLINATIEFCEKMPQCS